MKRIVSLLIVTIATGCVTFKEFQQLQTRVDNLDREKTALQEDRKHDIDRMERMHQDMQDATDALRKGGANLGADLDALKGDVARAKGANEELSYNLSKLVEDVERIKKALDDKFGLAVVALPKGLPEDANSLYKAGKDALAKNDTLAARGILHKFLDTFPDDPRAPEVQYLAGDTYFKEGKFGQAIKEYQRVYDRYKDVKDAPVSKSLMRIAESLLKENDCKKAGGVLKFVTETDRKSPEAERARDMLKDLKKKCKGL